jgi:PhnB protein
VRESDPFPPGFHSVNPYLMVKNVSDFIKFTKLVFNSVIVKLIKEDKGMYGEIKIGDTCIMVEENHKISHSGSISLWVYVRDVDATYDRALKAGCKSIQVPTCLYGVDYVAKVVDLFGITWLLATSNAGI